jgi:putative nucleotidyltransferase with HDIG domain
MDSFLMLGEYMKKRLLFVDDDINVLEGLRRTLRSQRDKWDMHFAGSGVEALQILETTPMDIVIADITMPGMNGIQLLEHVMDRFPNIIRMILSGYAESDLIMKSVAVTHQYLSKPCNPDILKSIITQAAESRTFLPNENLSSFVSKLGALPSVPILYREVTKELQSPEASLNKVGDIISQDTSMAAKILQLANSAFFGRRHSMSKITAAVAFLGLNCVAKLLLAIHAFEEFMPAVSGLISIEELWEHSSHTAIRAKMIAIEQHASDNITDDAFTAGLLHDIGKLILASRFPEEYATATKRAIASQNPLWVVEREIFSATHAEVGAYLLAIWGLPKSIVAATAFHHNPSATTEDGFCALTAVHAADTLENLTAGRSIR